MKIRTHLPHDDYEKNNIGLDYRMSISKEMSNMFNPDGTTSDVALTYQEITSVNQIKTHTITEEEYNQLSKVQKSIFFKIQYFMIFVFGLLAVILTICLFNNLGEMETEDYVMLIVTIVLFFTICGLIIKSAYDSTVRRNSQIAEGVAIFFNRVHNRDEDGHSTIRYYVSASIPYQQSYLKRITCSKYDYNRLEIGSRLYILVKGKKVYALAADAKK